MFLFVHLACLCELKIIERSVDHWVDKFIIVRKLVFVNYSYLRSNQIFEKINVLNNLNSFFEYKLKNKNKGKCGEK